MKKIISAVLSLLMLLTSFEVRAEEGKTMNKKVLVAYFSATGTTAGVAAKLAKAIDADLFEIKPEQPYTEADLDWRNKKSRSSVEMNDLTSRPAIVSKVEDMERYEVVFVGFPIWWYREPTIVDTFMESYDFAGKTVIPFATSGSSSIGHSGENLQKCAPGAKVSGGRRFAADVSVDELKNWAEEQL